MASKPTFRTSDEVEAVFYEAFMHCDTDVMAALWADGNVLCIHPGSGVIAGYHDVIRSWSHIFSQAQRPDIRFTLVKRMETDGLAVHLVAEEISSDDVTIAVVLATNVYEKFDNGWLMVEHHASLVQTEQQMHTLQ